MAEIRQRPSERRSPPWQCRAGAGRARPAAAPAQRHDAVWRGLREECLRSLQVGQAQRRQPRLAETQMSSSSLAPSRR